MPFIFVVYDAQADTAHWIYLQAYFQNLPEFDLRIIGETITIHLSKANIVNTDSVHQFAQFKYNVIRQRSEDIRYVF